jgi:hypothetical protein
VCQRATSHDSFFFDLQPSRRQQAMTALNPEEESIKEKRKTKVKSTTCVVGLLCR